MTLRVPPLTVPPAAVVVVLCTAVVEVVLVVAAAEVVVEAVFPPQAGNIRVRINKIAKGIIKVFFILLLNSFLLYLMASKNSFLQRHLLFIFQAGYYSGNYFIVLLFCESGSSLTVM
jgi:hypothetical protein